MTQMRLAVNVTITVVGTLLIAAAAYGGVAAARTHRTAQIHPVPPASSRPSPLPSPSSAPANRYIVLDADIVDRTAGWLLVSDCNSGLPSTCHYAVERTVDGGGTWSTPVLVGPLYSSQDGDAPRTIRFLDRINGFVYGHSDAFATHDGGLSWADEGFKGEIVGIAPFEDTVWAITRPCAKGVTCPYEVRSSHDGGVSWLPPHQLPSDFAPESLVAFRTGAIVSSLPADAYEMTADQGVSWQEIKSPCGTGQFRQRATTADGRQIWVLCLELSVATGAIDDATIFVSSNAGQTWSRRGVPGSLPAWLVAPKPNLALADGSDSMVLTTDSGLTWSRVSAGDARFDFARFLSSDDGWAMDSARGAWLTLDGGGSWLRAMTLPSVQP